MINDIATAVEPTVSDSYLDGVIQEVFKAVEDKKSEVNKFLNFIIKGLDKKGFLQPDHKRQSMIRIKKKTGNLACR